MVSTLIAALNIQGQIKAGPGQIKVDPKTLKMIPYTFKEPQDGYLSEFSWTGDVPVTGSLGEDKKFQKVTDSVMKAMKAKGIPGASVALIKNDEIIYSRAFGYTNLGTVTQFQPTSATRCGSISKTATALAILRLAELGKIDLNDKLINIFVLNNPTTGWKAYNDGWEKIRVRDLMDQCSGLPANSTYLTSHKMAEDFKKSMRLSKVDLLSYVVKNITPTDVQKKFAYTNLNFELLSLMIEVKTGKPYAQALQELVVKPLGIPRSQMFLSETKSSAPKTSAVEAHYYQKSTQMLESIYEKGKQVPEAYGGLDGDVLSGAGHIAFSSEAIAKIVLTLRTRPTNFIKKELWDEVINKPSYVSSGKNPQFSNVYYYSKGTYVTHPEKSTEYWFQHGAMLMHASGNYMPWMNCEVVVVANSNSKTGEKLHDQVLTDAIIPYVSAL